jgi:hypothetical protein
MIIENPFVMTLAKTKKMPKNLKLCKQLTFDNLPDASKREPAKMTAEIQEKSISITEICC